MKKSIYCYNLMNKKIEQEKKMHMLSQFQILDIIIIIELIMNI